MAGLLTFYLTAPAEYFTPASEQEHRSARRWRRSCWSRRWPSRPRVASALELGRGVAVAEGMLSLQAQWGARERRYRSFVKLDGLAAARLFARRVAPSASRHFYVVPISACELGRPVHSPGRRLRDRQLRGDASGSISTHDSPHEVVAFTVHRDQPVGDRPATGLPVVAFEDVASSIPRRRTRCSSRSATRASTATAPAICERGQEQGLALVSYVSSKAQPGATRRSAGLADLQRRHDPAVRDDRRRRVLWSSQPHRPPRRDRRLLLPHLGGSSSRAHVGSAATASSAPTLRCGTRITIGASERDRSRRLIMKLDQRGRGLHPARPSPMTAPSDEIEDVMSPEDANIRTPSRDRDALHRRPRGARIARRSVGWPDRRRPAAALRAAALRARRRRRARRVTVNDWGYGYGAMLRYLDATARISSAASWGTTSAPRCSPPRARRATIREPMVHRPRSPRRRLLVRLGNLRRADGVRRGGVGAATSSPSCGRSHSVRGTASRSTCSRRTSTGARRSSSTPTRRRSLASARASCRAT